MDKKIIIEIPHQSRVKTWVAYNDADIINRAYEIGLSYELKKSPYTKIKKLYTYACVIIMKVIFIKKIKPLQN